MSYHDHNHEDVEPMDPREFVANVKTEASVLLEAQDPIWSQKFKNFVNLVEGLAFKQGFIWGALASAAVSIVLLLVTR